MITIRLTEPAVGPIQLGEVICRFEIRAKPSASWRAYVKFQSVVYPSPIASSDPPGMDAALATDLKKIFVAPRNESEITVEFSLFPEAPGDYELHVVWHDNGSSGIERLPFFVTAGRPVSQTPRQVSVNNDLRVWAPGEWDGLHVSHYETRAFEAAKSVLRPGQIAYDIGANLGAFALHFLRCVGPQGRVCAFELNPVCVSFLLATIESAGHRNCTVFPVALGDRDGGRIAAAINFGNTAVGSIAAPKAFARTVSHEVSVECACLDTLARTFALPKPDLIKIDVEGSEAAVLAGMEATLEKFRPVLLIELHGLTAAIAALQRLDGLNYSIQDLGTNRTAANSAAFIAGMTDTTIQVLCRPENFQ